MHCRYVCTYAFVCILNVCIYVCCVWPIFVLLFWFIQLFLHFRNFRLFLLNHIWLFNYKMLPYEYTSYLNLYRLIQYLRLIRWGGELIWLSHSFTFRATVYKTHHFPPQTGTSSYILNYSQHAWHRPCHNILKGRDRSYESVVFTIPWSS